MSAIRHSGNSPRGLVRRSPTLYSAGFTLIEVMVAIAIGLVLTTGLTVLFANSSQSYGELHKQAQQIENGRYALDTIRDDIHHAAFYGALRSIPAPPAALPDPCLVSAAALTTAPYAYLALGVQGYDSPDSSPLSCLNDNDFVAGTDIIVVRRADSEQVTDSGGYTSCLGTAGTVNAPRAGDVYIQAGMAGVEVQFGNPTNFSVPCLRSDNTVSVVGRKPNGTEVATVLKMLNTSDADPVITLPRVAADIRKLHVHIYFIAPCSRKASGATTCTGAADGGNPIPTLKRLVLTASTGGAAQLVEQTLVEGIENLQIEYGIDDTPSTVNLVTGFNGDGVPDSYSKDPGTPVQWGNVMAARVFLLARNTLATASFTDDKTYDMGLEGTYTPSASGYRRHLYTTEVRLVNQAQRREAPL